MLMNHERHMYFN